MAGVYAPDVAAALGDRLVALAARAFGERDPELHLLHPERALAREVATVHTRRRS